MGTRLYPQTTDSALLEKLASVSPGTHVRLEEVKTRHKAELAGWTSVETPSRDRQEREYQHWKEIKNDEDLYSLDTFLTFGWGKFEVPDSLKGKMFDEKGFLSSSGSLSGTAAIELLEYNDITCPIGSGDEPTIEDLGGGVHWC